MLEKSDELSEEELEICPAVFVGGGVFNGSRITAGAIAAGH